MAPVDKKRTSDVVEEDAKRRKVNDDEESEEIEIGEEDLDEELMEQLMGDTTIEFGPEDFEGMDIDEETLTKFNEAYNEFVAKISENDASPMVITKAVNIRPVPTTVDEFEKNMIWVQLPEGAEQSFSELQEKFEALEDQFDAQLDQAEDEELDEKKLDEMHTKKAADELKLMEATVADLEKLEGKDMFQKFLIFTDMLFDRERHDIFAHDEHVEASVAMLNKFATAWEKLAQLDESVTGLTDKLKTAIMVMHEDQCNNITDGDWCQDEEGIREERPHKETTFAPKLI